MATTLMQSPGPHASTCAMATVQIDPDGHVPARDPLHPDTPASQSCGEVHWNEHEPPHSSFLAKHPHSEEFGARTAPHTPPSGQLSPQVGNGLLPHGRAPGSCLRPSASWH
jgi:hypothetical protein